MTNHAQLELPGVCDLPLGPQQACEAFGDAAANVGSSVFDDLVTALCKGWADGTRLAMTWWTSFRPPALTSSDGGPGAALAGIRDYTSGLQVVLLTAGILFAAVRLALAKHGGVAGEAQESFLMLARAVFGSMTFAAVITAGTRAGDRFADWVIFDASRGDLNAAISSLIEYDLTTRSGLAPGVLLVLGVLGIISMLVQLMMLVVRHALLILVVAVLPIAAAASGTGPGSQAYKKLLSWSLAFLLWKPVGALVYAIAFTAAGREQQDPQLVLLGMLLLVMTVIVLPALMRLVAPAVATLGGGGGAGAAIAGGLTGVAMAGMGGAAADGAQGRKVTEGENSPSPGIGPPAPSGGGGGGGGRPMPGGSTSGDPATPGTGGVPSAVGRSGGQHPPTATPASGKASGAAQGAGAETAVAGAVPAASAAQAVKAASEQGVSGMEAQVRDATEAGLDPDALGPGEVRR
ncbi:hypothetical protein [Nocardia brasiliensis]|uniref:hypothetical protein n=1 Tax=Nocardia brasiliensis TaxID=37326 RepID=UPI0018957C79|nr:hypothetical protein [Nocardia brasiliensis]MBF6125548.1 hypothetical protein [Nocardia brasiliensis]